MSVPVRRIIEPIFGQPTLLANGHSKANWFKSGTSPYMQKSATGWLADLYGGAQTGDDWAAIYVPVSELDVTELASAKWSYYMSATDVVGVNMVIWVHDPNDFDKRAEITQQADIATLIKAAGWNAHELDITTDQFYFYGEGTTGTGLTAGPPNYYGWDDFQADAIFKNWTIYRISFEFGWYGSGTLGEAWVADIQLNGQMVPLKPDRDRHYKTVKVQKTLEAEGTYTANDVMSESDTASAGTDWDFELGGTGRINRVVVVSATTGRTSQLTLYLYSAPPTCELDDNAANNGPLVADLAFYLGHIKFPAMVSQAGPSYTIASQTIVGCNIPFAFDKAKLYGVLVDGTGEDFGDDTTLDIIITAELDG